MAPHITIRNAHETDLTAINRVIEAAIKTWDLPERVIRLTLPTYKYNPMDLQHMDIVVALLDGSVVGVAAWEPAAEMEASGMQAMLLHGIYVEPAQQHQGIGRFLFQTAEQVAREQDMEAIVVKAQKGSEPFYLAIGMEKMAVTDDKREYENRFFKRLSN